MNTVVNLKQKKVIQIGAKLTTSASKQKSTVLNSIQ